MILCAFISILYFNLINTIPMNDDNLLIKNHLAADVQPQGDKKKSYKQRAKDWWNKIFGKKHKPTIEPPVVPPAPEEVKQDEEKEKPVKDEGKKDKPKKVIHLPKDHPCCKEKKEKEKNECDDEQCGDKKKDEEKDKEKPAVPPEQNPCCEEQPSKEPGPPAPAEDPNDYIKNKDDYTLKEEEPKKKCKKYIMKDGKLCCAEY